MFLLTYIYRQLSSGAEHTNNKTFNTLEEASIYIRTEWFDDLCETNDYPSYWDEDALGPMPSRDDFTVEEIQRKGRVLFAPYDKDNCIIQNELRIQKI
jgi:hypothetical protein